MSSPDDALLADLTAPQRDAVTHREGALLVLAGPGSGKTTVVTRRIACLIAQGVAPWRILALTFTNKAAGEMRERVDALLPGQLLADRPPTVATFHSFCARRLRQYAEAAGLAPHYSIYDEADRREAIKQALRDCDLSSQHWSPAAVGSAISRAKNLLVGAEAYAAGADDFFSRSVAPVYRAYEKILGDNDALDFDDLLLRMADLLRNHEGVRTQLQQRYGYVLIDEYQDTNHAQFVIAHTLVAGHGNLCVVGDPDQSIYGWRGADIGNILAFEEHHPAAAVVPLGQNFRSTGHIVNAADGLIRNNRRRKHKRLFTELEDGDRPLAVICRDERHEAAVVADFLRSENERAGLPWKEMAVLYRINALSRVLEEAFRAAEIPYVIARGTAFYERKEIRDALSYLRLLANPSDEVSLRRIINTPARGIGKTTFNKIELFAVQRQLRLVEALRRAGEAGTEAGLSARASGAVGRFVALFDRLQAAAARADDPAAGGLPGLVGLVIRESGLEATYMAGTDEDRERRETLDALVSAAAQFNPAPLSDLDGSEAEPLLNRFLESVALVSDADLIDPAAGVVTLMTLHAAKGLEFSVVSLVGLEENLLPLLRAAESDVELEEERRLCFVGMTRAKRRLLLTRAAVRTRRGTRTRTIQSRFLGELPPESIVRSDQAGEGYDDERDEVGAGAQTAATLEGALPIGCIVRHPAYGLGRVEALTRRAGGASAVVTFPTAGTKTFIVGRAPLERVG
ncbi:MAG: ATP-dependent helicase [Planctomycetota bacterium]|jgi:DNA helicase-2/ATP-dependent DNA helicase PcrA